MQLFMKSVRGPTLVFQVKEEMLVEELKQLIQDRDGVPVDVQRLVVKNKQLDDTKTLKESEVEDEDTIVLYIKNISTSTVNTTVNTTVNREKEEVLWVKQPHPALGGCKCVQG